MQWARKQKGFTIVELLIVIVVIAILAAITIVAYNGIQNRAKASAAQAAASQAAKKIALYAAEHNDQYPDTLEDAGITDTTGLQYSGGGSTFCVTATQQNVSYFQNNTSQPAAGACDGHGINGVAPITNLIPNPSVETAMTGYNQNNASSTIMRSADRAKDGSYSILVTAVDNVSGYNGVSRSIPVTAGKTYTFSAWVYLPAAYSTTGVAATTNNAGTPVKQGNFVTATGSWQRTTVSFTPTATGNAALYVITSSPNKPTAGATFYVDSFMFTEGSDLYEYADGTSPNWAWTGTPHLSTSKGSPL